METSLVCFILALFFMWAIPLVMPKIVNGILDWRMQKAEEKFKKEFGTEEMQRELIALRADVAAREERARLRNSSNL